MAFPYLRCPGCFASDVAVLSWSEDANASVGVADVSCPACGASFASVRGVPILASFDHTDLQTVVETLAVKGRAPRRSATAVTPGAVTPPPSVYHWLEQLWAGAPKAVVEQAVGPGGLWSLQARREELILAKAMLAGVPVSGALTLDVGAGAGVDSQYYVTLGARVIALEPNFALLTAGMRVYPNLQWLGGSADALPVQDASMDLVTATASLHHHLNVETSLDEMLRVLKPGGWLLTVADSVKGSRAESVEVDYQQWDTHPAVLSGINEQILRLDVLLDRLALYAANISAHVFLRDGNSAAYARHTLEEARALVRERPRLWGLVGLRVQKLAAFSTPEHRMRTGEIATPELARAIVEAPDTRAGYALLARLMHVEDLHAALPVQEVSRFLQLNGWRWPLSQARWRLAYRRGRLFMPRTPGHTHLAVRFGLPAVKGGEPAVVRVLLDGEELHAASVERGVVVSWQVPLPPGEGPCCITIELDLAADAPGAGEVAPAGHIAVERMELIVADASTINDHTDIKLLPLATLGALLQGEVVKLDEPVQLWAGPRLEDALEAIAALRAWEGLPVPRVHCAEVDWPFYAPFFAERSAAVESSKLVLFIGMESAEARKLSAAKGLAQAWSFDGHVATDLRAEERPFGDQLEPAASKEAAGLRQQLAKVTARLEATQAKLATAKERIQRLKTPPEKSARTGLWSWLRMRR